MNLEKDLVAYKPYNFQEEKDRTLLLQALRTEKDVFQRKNRFMHFTASAWVVSKDRTKVLLCFHRIYNSWSWLGGHADGEEDLAAVAAREVKEESGLRTITLLSPRIYSLESLTVDGHIKRGEYVSSHLHLNVTYLFEGDDTLPLLIKEDENSGVKWFSKKEALLASTEPWFVEHVYTKLEDKLDSFSPREEEKKIY